MKKRVLSFVLAVVMLIGILPSVTLFQASAYDKGGVTTTNHGTLNQKKSVSLPITVHNYPNDGMLFEYASQVSGSQYTYAHAHAERVTPGYGESWYNHGKAGVMIGGETMSYVGTFYIASKADRDFLLCHVNSGSTNAIQIYKQASTGVAENNKRWNAYIDGSGYYHFINVGSGLALDKDGTNRNLHGWTPGSSSNPNQQWTLDYQTDGYFRMLCNNRLDGSTTRDFLLADISGGTMTEGNSVGLWYTDSDSESWHKWCLIPVSGYASSMTSTGMADAAMQVSRNTVDASSTVGGFGTILNQGMLKDDARYLSLTYHMETENTDLRKVSPFKIVPISGDGKFALDVSGGTAGNGTKIQLWSSGNNNNSTTKYLLPEEASDGSYYLRWYYCDGSGNMSATNYYVGGMTGMYVSPSCKVRSEANRFYILQNGDGSYSFQLADVDCNGEPMYIHISGNSMAEGTAVLPSVWQDYEGMKFYLCQYNGAHLTFDNENCKIYPGFDGQETTLSGLSGNGLNVSLSTAPGYHTVVLDLSTAAGYAAAEKISSLSASTPAGKRATLSIAAAGLFGTQAEAEDFGKAVACGMVDTLSWNGYNASVQWVSTTESDYNNRGNYGGEYAARVRRYRMGNNLAFGMLLPNSDGYAVDWSAQTAGTSLNNNYQAFNNFGYAARWGSDDTIKNNLAAGLWRAYEVYEQGYYASTTSNDGRWFVFHQGDVGTRINASTGYPTATVNGGTYTDVSKFLPNMHSYIQGMATIGLVEYELDPDTKEPVYTQETVQKLAALLKQSLNISEKNGDDYNYNFVQGAKVYDEKGNYVGWNGTYDLATLIRNYLGSQLSSAPTVSEDQWASYVAGHKDLLNLSLAELISKKRDNCANCLDIAYWMLNTLYKDNNGISQTVPEYTHITFTEETNNSGSSYYVFDGGYDGVEYNGMTGGISCTAANSVKDSVYVYGGTNATTTTRNPFLPTVGSSTFQQTNSPYFADNGASDRNAANYETQIGRDYSYAMEGHGQFVFNTDSNLYFTFEGDDDVYLFINNKMVMDIGAAHSITSTTFNLNDYIKECGLKDGEMYDFDFYYMERHSYGANLRIETNIDVTTKYIDTIKGATQDGTIVDDGGLVDKTKALEYYISLVNKGYELPLNNLAFSDETIGFAAGYDGITLGSYTLNGETMERKLEDIKAVLGLADGTEIELTFADTKAFQNFLKDVKCQGHEEGGLAVGERLTIYGIRYGLTQNGVFKNTAYAEASSMRNSANFSVFAGEAQQYFMWAGHPIAVSVGDAASAITGVGSVTDFVPTTASGVTSSLRPLADGVYSIGANKGRQYSWTPKGESGELYCYNANELYGDKVEGNEPLFYVKYANNGYYTIYNLQYEQYVYIDAKSGTNSASTGAVDLDDRLKLVTMTEAQAATNDSTLWLIERNANISPNSSADSFIIRPKQGQTYGVDLDSGKLQNGTTLHLWTASSSGNVGWNFNAHANGDSNMTGFEDNILIFEEPTAGTYTRYFMASYSGSADPVKVPVVLHVLDVKDDTYVLDYGLPVDLNNANDGGLTNNDPIHPTGIIVNTLLEGLVSDEAYNGLKQLSKDGKLTSKTNGISGNTTDNYISNYGTFSADNGNAANTTKAARSTEIATQAVENDWSDTKPSGYTDDQLETRTVYHYRDKETKTTTEANLSGWTLEKQEWQKKSSGTYDYASLPSTCDTSNSVYQQYSKSALTAYENATEKRTIDSSSQNGYIHWHWCMGADVGALNRTILEEKGSYGGYYYGTFHAYFSTNGLTSADTSSNPPYSNARNTSVCNDTMWFFYAPVTRQTYTDYQKLFTYYRWGDWSDWSTESPTASSNRQVEQKTQYRVKSGSSGGGETGDVGQDVTLDSNSRKAYRITLASDSNWVLSINDASSTEWSTDKPTGYDDSQLETRTLYRYRTKITTTHQETHTTQYVDNISALDSYQSSHGLYQTYQRGPTTGDGISTVKIEDDGYVMWHYCSGYQGGPILRFIGWYSGQTDAAQYGLIGSLTTFHAWHTSTLPTNLAGATEYNNRYECGYGRVHYNIPGIEYSAAGYIPAEARNVCGEGFRWFYTPLHKQTWTKTTYTSDWSGWSDWSTTAVTATSDRQVETRTEYRVKEDLVAQAGTGIALQARDDANTAQLWYLEKQSDGSVKITNAKSGMTLQIANTAANGVKAVQSQSSGANAEKWRLTTAANGTVSIRSYNAQGFYLDLTDGKKVQNQSIQIWTGDGTNVNQQWLLSPIYQSDTYTRLIFTPEKIMSGASSAKTIVRVTDASQTPSVGLGNVDVHKEVEMYEKVTTIPASVVYYEDNFAGLDYNQNTDSTIDQIGGGDGDFQDADQSGQYGHDGHYENEGYESSGGSVTKITVTADEQIFSFKFRGTGFEIISRATANCSANIIATVFDASNTKIREIPVITEYNNNGGEKGEEAIYQVPAISVNDLVAGDYTVKVSVTARQIYDGWKTEYVSYENGVIKYKLTDQDGTVYYKYFTIADNSSYFTKEDGTKCKNPMLEESYLFIDGIRIFNPLDGLTDENGDSLDNGYQATEKDAKIYQIHDEIINGNILVAESNSDGTTLSSSFSTFTENRNSNLINGNNSASVNDYALIGPNNEVYLDGLSMRQAMAFYVKPDGTVPAEECTLQIGVRALDAAKAGGYTELQLSDEGKTVIQQSNANGGTLAWSQIAELTAGTEQYYVLDPSMCAYDAERGAYLVVVMPVNGLVSFTGLKLKGYTLVRAWESGSIQFGADGKLTDASIEIANKMLDDFVPQMDSTLVVEARSNTGKINIILSSPEEPTEPTEPTEPSTDPEKPTTEPTEPSSEPEKPTTEPTEPSSELEKPTEPTEPSSEPEKPTTEPTDPSTKPEQPEETPFPDIAGTWYEKNVVALNEAGILNGFEDGLFHGELGLTREQFAAMLVRGLKLEAKEIKNPFTDISGRWSEKEILTAVACGLVNGVSETEFAPEREITRQEMMTMIARALRSSELTLPKPANLEKYEDADQVAPWALDSVKLLVATGIINGKSETELMPEGKCLRCEAAAVIYRLLDQLAEN